MFHFSTAAIIREMCDGTGRAYRRGYAAHRQPGLHGAKTFGSLWSGADSSQMSIRQPVAHIQREAQTTVDSLSSGIYDDTLDTNDGSLRSKGGLASDGYSHSSRLGGSNVSHGETCARSALLQPGSARPPSLERRRGVRFLPALMDKEEEVLDNVAHLGSHRRRGKPLLAPAPCISRILAAMC